MAKHTDYASLPDSERLMLPGAQAVGPARQDEPVEVTVRLRSQPADHSFPAPEMLGAVKPQQRFYLDRDTFETTFGASQKDIAKIETFAKDNGLQVVQADSARRSVILSGTVAQMNTAFGIKLTQFTHPGGDYRGRVGSVHLPSELLHIVQGVFGLDNRRSARPYVMLPKPGIALVAAANNFYYPPDVAKLYNFPTGLTGQGQTIGILEFGGGYNPNDLSSYFQNLKIAMPQITSVSVDHVQNNPGGNQNEVVEVVLDIEIAGAIAPGAKIVVYFAPFTQRGWVDVLSTAVHDKVNKPSVISISWGYTEGQYIWTKAGVNAVNQSLQAAAALGVTVVCAAGDDGSEDQVTDGHAHVDFPASSPYILSCGGTTLKSSNGVITSEIVWNGGTRDQGGATGGGISNFFGLPTWQTGANVPKSVNPGNRVGRGVPDVAGVGDGATGYIIRVGGQDLQGVGGTSAVSPLISGLIALINQKVGKPVGYFNPLLYSQFGPGGIFHDITIGNNDPTGHIGGYPARKGWDACTGWGSPDGSKLLAAFL